jgi:hypothetical protein
MDSNRHFMDRHISSFNNIIQRQTADEQRRTFLAGMALSARTADKNEEDARGTAANEEEVVNA